MKALRLAVLLIAAAAAPVGAYAQQANEGNAQRRVTPPVPRQQEKVFPTGTSWVAVSLNGRPFSGDRPSFSIDAQFRARGFGGCNNYSATAYPLRQQTLAVGPIALTKRKCSGNANAVEQSFLMALRTARQWDTAGSTLIIRTEQGELRFNRSL
jgi:Heat shock protein